MFVGDVRCATVSSGTSWTLSGGSAWSSGPMNVSKYRHVFSATDLRNSWSSALSATRRVGTGRLSAYAITGAAAHSTSTGTDAGHACGRTRMISARLQTATSGLAI